MLIGTLTGKDVFPAASLDFLIPKRDIPEGWALTHGPKTYTRKTLFEHINGQAELYLKYGFQGSIFATYESLKSHENQIEVDIYDLGNVLHAFGIFSRLRSEESPAGIGLDSYVDDQTLFFYKGKYFVMLFATESNPPNLKALAAKIALKILDHSPPPKEIGYFPKDGLKPGSIQYVTEGLLGQRFLGRGFEAAYVGRGVVEAPDKALRLFLAIFKDSKDAAHALKTYKGHLLKRGKVFSDVPNRFGSAALTGEDPYHGEVTVVQKGAYLIGGVGFERRTDREDLLREFVRNVK